MVDWLEVLVGALLGFVLSIALVYLQFRSSIAGRRVKWVKEATGKIISTPRDRRGPPRNRYRFSLGVIIDDFDHAWQNGFNSQGDWPALADSEKDRWERFREHIRPVAEDIDSYTFLGIFFFLLPGLGRLRKLEKLCIHIEEVVMLTDAACEPEGEQEAVIEFRQGRIFPSAGEKDEKGKLKLEELKEGYSGLYKAWREWLKATGTTKNLDQE
jgi:hypothetical protein